MRWTSLIASIVRRLRGTGRAPARRIPAAPPGPEAAGLTRAALLRRAPALAAAGALAGLGAERARAQAPVPAAARPDGAAPVSAFADVAAAERWQDGTGGALAVTGDTPIDAPLVLHDEAAVFGTNPRRDVLRLTSREARLDIGGDGARQASGVVLSRFTIRGSDLARVGLLFSDERRPEPRSIAWSVYTGNARVTDVQVLNCREVGIHIGADSDDTQMSMIRSQVHRAPGTRADAIRVEAPTHISLSVFGGCTGYAFRADVRAARSPTPEMVYTVDSSRINFARRGLVYHDGVSDSGQGGAIGIFDKCFFENCGFAGTVAPAKEPADEATLEPAAIHCAGGRLNIVDPKKLQCGWGRSLVKASRQGQVNLRLGGCEAKGASSRRRDCTLLVAGLVPGHGARITVEGPLNLTSPDDFAEIARVAPRLDAFPIDAPGGETLWRDDLADPAAWSATGAEVSAADPADIYEGAAALRLRGLNAPDARIERRLRVARAAGRVILFQAAVKPERSLWGSGAGLGAWARLSGAGLRGLTPHEAETPWGADARGEGRGDWVHLCAAAFVEDPDEEVTLSVFCGRTLDGAPCEAAATLGFARLLLL